MDQKHMNQMEILEKNWAIKRNLSSGAHPKGIHPPQKEKKGAVWAKPESLALFQQIDETFSALEIATAQIDLLHVPHSSEAAKGVRSTSVGIRGEDGKGPPALEDPSSEEPSPSKKLRRRHIDPTTCDRDYSLDEVEFMNALDDYKRTNGRMFPTCSEILEVIRSLGYVKISFDATQETTEPENLSETPLI